MGNDWFREYFINELKAIGRKPTSNMQHEVVDSLPSSGNEQTIYFVKNDSSSSNNHYDEYVWISSSSTFEKIGSTQIDGSTTHPDWNQNDDTQPDYIKNRPFYEGNVVEKVMLDKTDLSISYSMVYQGYASQTIPVNFNFEIGTTYKVTWDGTVYECVAYESGGEAVIGSKSIRMGEDATDEPFYLQLYTQPEEGLVVFVEGMINHTISISSFVAEIKKLDEKFLPEIANADDGINFLFDNKILNPVSKTDGVLFTDNDGKIFYI